MFFGKCYNIWYARQESFSEPLTGSDARHKVRFQVNPKQFALISLLCHLLFSHMSDTQRFVS